MRRFVIGFAIGLASLSPTWAHANDDQIAQQIIERLETQKSEGKLKGFNQVQMRELLNVAATMGMATSRNTLLEGSTVPCPHCLGSGLVRTHLLDDAMHVALPASHRCANAKRVSMAELAGDRWGTRGRRERRAGATRALAATAEPRRT